jgi:hypothetical protein
MTSQIAQNIFWKMIFSLYVMALKTLENTKNKFRAKTIQKSFSRKVRSHFLKNWKTIQEVNFELTQVENSIYAIWKVFPLLYTYTGCDFSDWVFRRLRLIFKKSDVSDWIKILVTTFSAFQKNKKKCFVAY